MFSSKKIGARLKLSGTERREEITNFFLKTGITEKSVGTFITITLHVSAIVINVFKPPFDLSDPPNIFFHDGYQIEKNINMLSKEDFFMIKQMHHQGAYIVDKYGALRNPAGYQLRHGWSEIDKVQKLLTGNNEVRAITELRDTA